MRVRLWMLASAAWSGPALLGAVDVVAQAWLRGSSKVDATAALFVGGDWLLYALLTPGVFALSRRWPLARPRLRQNAAIQCALSLPFCAAWAFGGTLLKAWLRPDDLERGASHYFVGWLFVTLPFGVAAYLALVGVEHAGRYFVETREREAQVARLSEQLASARLTALRAQLNPHFLFNSLNTVAVLVRGGDGAAAAGTLERLSEVLRRTLRTRANEVALDDELELARQYLAVEQARFADRLRPEIVVPPSLRSAAVPSFSVQGLVENAVRHGIARRSDAGRVAVTARRDGDALEVTVEDDGAGVAEGARPAKGRGIENARERLRALYGEAASLAVFAAEGRGTVARLRVPLRELVLEERPDGDGGPDGDE